jgi:predicted pyridoxine 5'-phosphate oxidase superfamily flavin-nucleotide-binding protein
MGILTGDMKRVVNEQRLAYVATVCPDGTPNLSPKATTTVWDDDHLVYADIRSPNTRENLRHNPVVEVNVVDPISRKGYRFKGRAAVLTEGAVHGEVLEMYRRRGQDYSPQAVVLIRVERALLLVSPAYDSGRTEEDVRAEFFAYYDALNRPKTGAPA